MFTPQDYQQLDKAKAEMDSVINSETSGASFEKARELLAPLVEKGMPEAQYLAVCCPLENEFVSNEAFTLWRLDLIRRSANAGYAPARFTLGQAYDGGDLGNNPEESAYWFAKAAEQGYAYAQWVHGCNLISGRGIPKDEKLAFEFIIKAAEGKFIGAMQFLSDAYRKGSYGFPQDADIAEEWQRRSTEGDVIGY